MNVLLVYAHPEPTSFTCALKNIARDALIDAGHSVEVSDLYGEGFNPVAGRHDFTSVYDAQRFHYQNEQGHAHANGGFAPDLVREQQRILKADLIVWLYPIWWGGVPAILKGWFDRVWAPGHAYQHAADLGAITPGLLQLQEVRVVTTLGSPWWVDLFVLRRPVRRVLKLALLGACTRGCSFRMLSFYRSEKADRVRVDAFVRKIRARF